MVALGKRGHWLAAATLGVCLLSPPADAQGIVPKNGQMIRDVELGRGGLLVGRLLDANGRPIQAADISLSSGGKSLASTRTDADGVFAATNLRGGVHEIATADSVQVCRLWAADTAPPHAPKSIELVSDPSVVRGQYGPPPGNRFIKKAKVWATNPFVVGGVVAAAVAIPIALSDNDGPHS